MCSPGHIGQPLRRSSAWDGRQTGAAHDWMSKVVMGLTSGSPWCLWLWFALDLVTDPLQLAAIPSSAVSEMSEPAPIRRGGTWGLTDGLQSLQQVPEAIQQARPDTRMCLASAFPYKDSPLVSSSNARIIKKTLVSVAARTAGWKEFRPVTTARRPNRLTSRERLMALLASYFTLLPVSTVWPK